MMKRPDNGMMNVSARPVIESNNWFLFGDALYWRAEEDGTEWARNSVSKTTDDTPELNVNAKKIDFEWDWGFRAGIGYNMEHDQWDTQLYYTWFRTEKSDHVSRILDTASPAILVPAYFGTFFIGGSHFQSDKITWKIHFNMFDWELGRNYLVSKNLALRPHLGVKGGWIHQSLHGHAKTFSDILLTYKDKNNFWGVGPSGGVNTKWNLGNVNTHFFSLFGDFAGALMWGHWDVNHHSFDIVNGEIKFKHLNKDQCAAMLQAFMGFGWETNFNGDQCHLAIKLGYEVQHWFNQLKLFPPTATARYNYDLSFQGGTLDVRLDF